MSKIELRIDRRLRELGGFWQDEYEAAVSIDAADNELEDNDDLGSVFERLAKTEKGGVR